MRTDGPGSIRIHQDQRDQEFSKVIFIEIIALVAHSERFGGVWMNSADGLYKLLASNEEMAPLVEPLLEEHIVLKEKLADLKKYPFIYVNPDDPYDQKAMPAEKEYKELLQQDVNVLKAMEKWLRGGDKAESPLQEWIEKELADAE